MSLSNRPEWKFQVSLREMQFLIAGLGGGLMAYHVARAASAPEGAWFGMGIGLFAAFGLVSFVRLVSS